MYCHMFPNMDPDRALDSRAQPNAWDIANNILYEVGNRFTMPGYWQDSLARLHGHYRHEKANWRMLNGSPGSTTSDSGGGLKLYESQGFEADHLELGSQLDKNWSRKTKPDDWKLTHDAAAEGQNGFNSPTMNFKTEDTPASTPASTSGFNAVNHRKSTSEAPSLPSSKRMPWPPQPSPTTGPIRPYASYDIPQSPQVPQLMPNPNAESTMMQSNFNRNADLQSPLPGTGHYAPREHSLVIEAGSDRPASEVYWTSQTLQPAQQAQQTQESAELMRLRGQHSIGMNEWTGFQRAEHGEFQMVNNDWLGYSQNYPPGIHFPDSFDEGYPASSMQ